MSKKSLAGQLAPVITSCARVEPHGSLTEFQRDLWIEIVNSLPADFFRPGDVPLLSAYCKAWSFYLQAAAEVEKLGITLEDDRGRRYANPAQSLLVT